MKSPYAWLLIVGMILFSSCSDWGDGWAVIQGNASFQRGEFQKSSLNYLAAHGNPANLAVVNYNLGNVYNSLGETNSALSVWSSISNAGSEELAFRLAFNKGYLLYQRGQYEPASQEFRTALLMKPASMEAKRNLEICLLKTQNFGTALPARSRTIERNEPGETQKALLDYINRLEGTRWKANNRQEPTAKSTTDW